MSGCSSIFDPQLNFSSLMSYISVNFRSFNFVFSTKKRYSIFLQYQFIHQALFAPQLAPSINLSMTLKKMEKVVQSGQTVSKLSIIYLGNRPQNITVRLYLPTLVSVLPKRIDDHSIIFDNPVPFGQELRTTFIFRGERVTPLYNACIK